MQRGAVVSARPSRHIPGQEFEVALESGSAGGTDGGASGP